MSKQANPEYAVPGDTIEITHPLYSTGMQFVVTERSSEARKPNAPGDAWIMMPDGPGFWKAEHYKIIKRKGEGVVSDTPVDLDKSLRQKRDKLLRGWFT